MATLQELKEVYDVEDALTLYEIVMVNAYNEHVALENSKSKK